MGHLREKYTKEYFTGKNEKGESAGYGATLAYDNNGDLTLREHNRGILGQINFEGKKVFGFGIGRGEELIYAINNGANSCLGVDFSENAIEIASEIIKNNEISSIKLINEDALVFLKNYVSKDKYEKFDVVIMFDFVEHVPRAELREIFQLLKMVLNKQAVLVINTPAYKFDNDVIRDNLDKRNLVNCMDTSDTNEATVGMHCNKYTVPSLQSFMEECGYKNVTEMHFFVKDADLPLNFSWISFAERWKLLCEKGFPIKEDYADDIIEYPYSDAPKLKWHNFNEGNLSGISLYLTDDYASVCFANGNIDDARMIADIVSANKAMDNLIIFDIGAFVGADSLVFAKIAGLKARIIAFEPNEYNRNRLFLNLSHNTFSHGKITVFPYALGDKVGKLKMNISMNIDEGHSSTSRVREAHSKIGNNSLPDGFFETTVEVMTLDEFVERYGIIPDIMKVDIEGAEHLMLAGAMNTLRKYKPIIYTEIHSEYCALICYKFLESVNYRVSVIYEENDNRLMIKAIYNADNKNITPQEFMAEAQRNLNASKKFNQNINSMQFANEKIFNPLISIVIPIYNGANFMRQAIDSALAQTYSNIEVIVVNDGSTDETEKIAKSYGNKIRYFVKENGGVASALNLGLCEMKGEYFSWLSHDDLFLSDKLEKQMEFIATLKNKNTILYSDFEFIDKNAKKIKTMKLDHEMLKLKPEYSLFHGCVNGNTLLIPKKAFEEYGFFDEKLKCTQDYAMWFEMMKTYKFVHMPNILAKYRTHQMQESSKNPDAVIEGNELWIKMMKDLPSETKARLEGNELAFFKKMVFYLRQTPYKKAMEFANNKANEILLEDNKPAIDFTKIFVWPDRIELRNKIRFIVLSPIKFMRKYFK